LYQLGDLIVDWNLESENKKRPEAPSWLFQNIAEAFKRRSPKGKSNFYKIAQGSLEELRYYAILAKDLRYSKEPKEVLHSTAETGRMLNGLISSLPG
jgi:four helix bundle protein